MTNCSLFLVSFHKFWMENLQFVCNMIQRGFDMQFSLLGDSL